MMVGFSGFLAGGAVQQANARRQQATADRGVDVEEDRLAAFRQQITDKASRDRIVATLKRADILEGKSITLGKAWAASGKPVPPSIQRTIDNGLRAAQMHRESAGQGGGGARSELSAGLAAAPPAPGPTAQKLSDVGGALKRPLTEQETRRGGGVAEPAGQTITVNTGDVLAGEDKPAARTTRDNLIGINDNLEAANRALGSLKKSPLAAGVVGGVIESGLGIVQSLGQLAGVEIAPQFQADFDKARNDARLLTGQLISVVTGEESSRFSNQEREITNEAQRTLTTDASAPQALAALKNMIGVFESSQTREIGKAVAQAKIDIKAPAGRKELSNILRSAGFSEERIVDATLEQMRLAGIRL